MNMDIKTRLAAGETVDSLMKEMHNQVVAAARELEKEKVNKKVEIARDRFTNAMVDYLVALGLVSREDLEDEDVEELKGVLKEFEKELSMYIPFIKVMKKDAKDAEVSKEDAVLRDFLKKSLV